ncbi:MAG: YlbF family regulator [Firmicutes bacterium]|nr:YlbF family regulator [Bacillota bacterium]
MNVHDHAYALAKAIKSSSEYKNFKQAAEKLEKDSSAKKMLSGFRKSQWELQQQKLSGLEIAPEQEQRLAKVWEVISLNLVVKEYLENEYRFSILLSDIQKIIGEPLEDIISLEIGESDPEQNKTQQ